MEKIGLIQIDGTMPNLALMKLATHYKRGGANVIFIDLSTLGIDKWFGSKIFMGGTGFDIKSQLPADIEAEVPDYQLYNLDHSIGFTSRGCIRDCGFCIVREKEGNIKEVADWEKAVCHSKYIMMDNNLLASSKCMEKLDYFINNKIKVCFHQGLDIRLIDDEKSKKLSQVKYYDSGFKTRMMYIAFDNPKMEPTFREHLEILLRHVPAGRIMVYILANYNTTFEEDMRRFQVVNEFGCDPYIMVYNKKGCDKQKLKFARWINKRIYKATPWTDYDPNYSFKKMQARATS